MGYCLAVFAIWTGGFALAADVVGGGVVASGGAGVAAPDDNVGITLNPGTLALEERYDFAGLFRYGPDNGLEWGASAMDARTSPYLALGLAYSGARIEPELTQADLPGWIEQGAEISNQVRSHEFTTSAAVPLLDRRLSVGLGVAVGLFDTDRHGKYTSIDGHVGVAARPIDGWVIGASGRNLLAVAPGDRPPQVWLGTRVLPSGGRGGAPREVPSFELDAGFEGWSAPSPLVAAGIEVPVSAAAVRGGFRYDSAGSAVTAGIGYTSAGGAIEYGLVVPLGDLRLGATVHQVSVRFSAGSEIETP
ncbi:MAG: hypothetical protein ABMA64_35315 [Myxococcota bacterium]